VPLELLLAWAWYCLALVLFLHTLGVPRPTLNPNLEHLTHNPRMATWNLWPSSLIPHPLLLLTRRRPRCWPSARQHSPCQGSERCSRPCRSTSAVGEVCVRGSVNRLVVKVFIGRACLRVDPLHPPAQRPVLVAPKPIACLGLGGFLEVVWRLLHGNPTHQQALCIRQHSAPCA
jgi:hypothetical protein